MLRIALVYITYNRLHYTKLSLPRLLEDPSEEFDLTLWDNGSEDGTQDFLRSIKDPRIVDVVLCGKNRGQIVATNETWSKSEADLLGKVDNDCLVTPGWMRTLAQAHGDVPELGVVACWHFLPDDFDYDRAKHKIQEFNGHRIFRHPWTCGTGLLTKRAFYERLGPIEGPGTTGYWLKLAFAGCINGFYYPLVHQEHMDDPKSPYTSLRDEAAYQTARAVTFNLDNQGLDTLEKRWRWREEVLRCLLDDPYEPAYYSPWRSRLRRWRAQARKYAGDLLGRNAEEL